MVAVPAVPADVAVVAEPALPALVAVPALPAVTEVPAEPALVAVPAVPAEVAVVAEPALPALVAVPAVPAEVAVVAAPAKPAFVAVPAEPAVTEVPALPALVAVPAVPAEVAVVAAPAKPAFVAVPASLNATVSAASISAAATMMTGDTSAAYSTGTFTCGATAGTKSINIAYQNASGTVAVSPAIPVRCAGNAYSYTASFDKASYVQGEIATLTVQFKDSSGNNSNSYGTTGAASGVVTSPMLTMIGTVATGVLPDVNGQVKHKFTVGGNTAVTAGSYNALVDYPTLVAAESATIQTIAYKVSTGGSSVTNEDVLKSIVALIASINKQIQALQKLILKR